jgi:SecD/SecF fusion protein
VRNRGNLIIILLVLGLLAAAGAVIATHSAVLGLDLRGGSEIILKAQPDKDPTTGKTAAITPQMMSQAKAVYERRVNALGTTEPQIQVEGSDQISIQVPGEKNPERLTQIIGSTGNLFFIPLETGLTPGVSRSVVNGAAGISPKNSLYELLNGSQTLANGQFDSYYAFNAKNQVQGHGQAATSQQGLLELLGTPNLPAGWKVLGVPHDKLAVSCTVTSDRSCPGTSDTVAAGKTGKTYWYMFDKPAPAQLLTGRELTNAQADFDPQTGAPQVDMSFNDSGASKFEAITKQLAHAGRDAYNAAKATDPSAISSDFYQQFAVILDNQLETWPYINFDEQPNGIPGNNSRITGVSLSEAKDISTVLSSGSLPVTFIRLSQSQVSATLGKKSLQQGLVAGLAGLVVVMIYMLVFYRFLGLIADIALLIYAALYFALILAIPVTLTLPGIAGLILTIGVAADANVVVFERIKEEVRAGKTVRAAIAGGYTKGFRTIIDANAVTLITAAVLFIASQASVRGFALLLALGVLVSMFTAVAATRAMLGIVGGFRWFNNAAFMGATAKPVRWHLDFIGRTKLWFVISGTVIAIGLGFMAVNGLNKGLDFTGGTRIAFTLSGKQATTDQIHALIAPIDPKLSDAVVRGSGTSHGDDYSAFQIDSKELPQTSRDTLRLKLGQQYGSSALQDFNESTVSASFGSEILRGAVLAFIFSIGLIVLYLAFRFDWRYAVPTIAALIHDLLVTVGVYAVTGREVTSATVAAVLTILGYSLYDTIIVFDRVRENERLLRKHNYAQIVNISLWETMTRSLNTSCITLLPILSLFVFGGATLKDFAFALLIGIASGAYSSFFIASPLLVMLKKREPEFARRPGSEDLPAVFLRSAAGPVMTSEPALVPAGAGAAAPPSAPAPRPGAAAASDDARAAARRRRLDKRR